MDSNLLNRYYLNLDVKPRSNKHEISISSVIRNKDFKGENFLNRCAETVEIITNELPLFKSACHHSDVPGAIKTFLTNYLTNVSDSCYDFNSEKGKREIWMIMLTLFSYCAKQEVQHFLETSLIKNSSADNYLYGEYKNLLSHQTIEIILLEDSDLYAVVNNLKISENYRYLSKIWVPQSIKHNFLSLRNQYFKSLSCAIRIYKSEQELLTPPIFYKINVTSIWSENITTAKNLAASLDRNIVLINTLDFYESMVIIPYVEIFKVSLSKHLELDEDQHIISMIKPIRNKEQSNVPTNPVYSLLFYDGTWQNPVKNNYWLNKITLTANATSDDISRCIVSARKGFKIWSIWTNESRMQMLSKFAFALKNMGKVKLSKIVDKWVKFPHWYGSSWIPQYSDRLFHISIMVVRSRKPKGIIILMEKEETDLFRKLTQSLVIGNSVIVICTAQSSNLAQYCDMFATCGIPPGVINLLSCENVKPLSECYNATELDEIYDQFTVSKQITTNI